MRGISIVTAVLTLLFAVQLSIEGRVAKKAAQTAQLWPDGSVVDDWFRAVPDGLSDNSRRFVITDYGVACSSSEVQTIAIQSVIDSCAAAGGGIVVIPSGTFYSGTLNFRQGTHLYLEEGAVLKGSDFIGDFFFGDTRIEGESCKYFGALIQADGLDGFTIGGQGTIDGNGWRYHRSFWLRKKWNKDCTNKDEQRPRLVYISNSRNVTIQGITMKDSPFWTSHFYKCENLRLLDLTISSVGSPKEDSGPSTDAIDLDVVHNVLIKGCNISVNDDGIAMKGGKGPWADDQQKCPGNGGNTNVLIEDCHFGEASHCCLTLGSESVYNRNIVMRRCSADCPRGIFFRLKIRRDTPQEFEYVSVTDCKGSAHCFFRVQVWDQFFDLKGRPDEPISYARNIVVKNCDFTCDKPFIMTSNDAIYRFSDFDIEANKLTYRTN